MSVATGATSGTLAGAKVCLSGVTKLSLFILVRKVHRLYFPYQMKALYLKFITTAH